MKKSILAIALATSTALVGTAVYAQDADVQSPPTPLVEAPLESSSTTTEPIVATGVTTILHKFDENGEACEIGGNVVYLEHGEGTLKLNTPKVQEVSTTATDKNVVDNGENVVIVENSDEKKAVKYTVTINNEKAIVVSEHGNDIDKLANGEDDDGSGLFGIGGNDNGEEGNRTNENWELKSCT